jgi:adenylosuccinate lyase
VLNALAGLCASLHKFAFDLRMLQAPLRRVERALRRQAGRVERDAFQAQPDHAENIDSLARLVAALPRVAWDNAALSLLERTLDDSANRRLLLPEAFLLTDELVLSRSRRLVVQGMRIWPGRLRATCAITASLPPPSAC